LHTSETGLVDTVNTVQWTQTYDVEATMEINFKLDDKGEVRKRLLVSWIWIFL